MGKPTQSIMREIILTKGKVAFVDDDDYERLNKFKWCTDGRYAIRREGARPGYVLFMHKEVLNTNEKVDHINEFTYDNRKENLRLATQAQNSMNRGLQVNSTTGYKGVSANKGRYQAYIKFQGKKINLGTYDTKEEAARAYDSKALELFGEFAKPNFD